MPPQDSDHSTAVAVYDGHPPYGYGGFVSLTHRPCSRIRRRLSSMSCRDFSLNFRAMWMVSSVASRLGHEKIRDRKQSRAPSRTWRYWTLPAVPGEAVTMHEEE